MNSDESVNSTDAEKLLPRSKERAIQEFEWLLDYKDGYAIGTEGLEEEYIHQPKSLATPSPSIRHRNLSQPGSLIWPPPSPHSSRFGEIPDNYIPPLDADGGISLPPPHELEGSFMQSAISVQNLSQPGTPVSPRPSPLQRFSGLPDNYIPAWDGVGGISLPPPHELKGSFMQSAIDISSQSLSRYPSPLPSDRSLQYRSRSRSPIMPDTLDPAQKFRDGLLEPEHIMAGPTVSDPSLNTALQRGRLPNRKGMATSQVSGRSSPLGQMSILSRDGGGALGLSRGEREPERRDSDFVVYPNVSTSNLNTLEEERRSSNYNASPSGRPPVAPRPQPPSQRNRSGPIVLDKPLPAIPRSSTQLVSTLENLMIYLFMSR